METLDTSAKRRRAAKCCGCLMLPFIALALAFPSLDQDEPETIPDPRRDVPDGDNAFPGIVEAVAPYAGSIVTGSDGMPQLIGPSPTDTHPPEAVEESLRLADEALTRPECALPKPTSDTEMSTARSNGTLALHAWSRLKTERGRRRAAESDQAGAVRDFVDITTVGRRLAAGGGTPTDYYTVMAVESIGLGELEAALGPAPDGVNLTEHDPTGSWPTSGWTPADRSLWRGVLEDLLYWDEEPAAVQTALAIEYHLLREGYLGPDAAGPGLGRYPTIIYMPRSTIRLARQIFEEALRQAGLPPWERDPSKLAVPKPTGLQRLLNGCGRSLLEMIIPTTMKVIPSADARRARVNVTAAHIAIKLYLEDHGRLPADWPELVDAGILPAAPLDPFTGDPLIYRPREGLVYSVGENARDDGGAFGRGTPDIGARLAFVVPGKRRQL